MHQHKIFLALITAVFIISMVSADLATPTVYWRTNEVLSSTIAVDTQGVRNLTANLSTGNFVTGKLGNSFILNTTHNSRGLNTTGSASLAFSTGTFSFGFWINGTKSTGSYVFHSYNPSSTTGYGINQENNLFDFTFINGGAGGIGTGTMTENTWHRVWFVREGTGANQFKVYVDNNNIENGTLNSDISDTSTAWFFNSPNGGTGVSLDDIRVYDGYALSVADVNTDWNSGNGQQLGEDILTITLNSPISGMTTTNASLIFNYTAVVSGTGTFANATIYVWNSTTTVFNRTNHSLTGILTSKSFNISNFAVGNYHWNVYACTSTNNCSFSATNNTFTWGYLETARVYNTTTTDLATESFRLNIDYSPSATDLISATFYYNGTAYATTKTESGTNISFVTSISTPIVAAPQTKNFYWTLSLTKGTTTNLFNTTVSTQTINPINASILGKPYTVPFINFTIYDEDTRSKINATFQGTFNYGKTSLNKNLSFNDMSGTNNTWTFSFNPYDGTYIISGLISSSATNYVTKLYTLQQTSVSNATTNISLYLLNSSRSTSFVVKVRDSSYAAVVGAVVEIQRYYPSTDEWITTEAVETNIEGKGLGHFVTEDVNYRFKVYEDSELVYTSIPTKVFCEVTPCTITLTIPASASNGFSNFENLPQLQHSLSYAKATETITFSYVDSNSSAQGGRLYVVRTNTGIGTDVVICDTTSANPSAVLTCTLGSMSNGTYVAIGYVNRTSSESILVDRIVISKTRNIVGEVGSDGVFFSAMLLIAIVSLGMFSPIIAIVFAIFGVVMLSFLGLVSIPILSVTALIAIGIVMLWELRR